MSKQVHFTVEIPENADVKIETKITVIPVVREEIDLDSLTEDDIDEICDAHYDSHDCPLMANCPFGGECCDAGFIA